MVRPEGVAADAIVRVFRVPPESAGMRADVFLQSQLRNTSRTKARAIVEQTAFTPTGRRIRPNDRVRAEDHVVLWRPPFEADEPAPPLAVLHEDEHLLVIDKPPLVAVHPTARYHNSTVIKRLEEQRPGEFLSLVHRLDRETSGLLLVARSPEADRAFKRVLEDRSVAEMVKAESGSGAVDSPAERFTRGEIAQRRRAALRAEASPVDKEYLAITWGVPPEGDIDLPLDTDGDNPLRVKMRVAERGTGLDARTGVAVREVRGRYALVACALHTGRQHQIRVHLAAVGCPVVGDKLYGPDERMIARAADGELTAEDLQRLELPRHALHAHRYRLRHPLTDTALDLVSPLPADLAEFWGSRE